MNMQNQPRKPFSIPLLLAQASLSIPALLVAGLLLLAPAAQAATLQWDANGTTAGQTDGAGTWLNANQWWDGSTNVTWNNSAPDNATIGNGSAGATITIGAVNAGSVTFGSFTGTYTLSGTGSALTQSGGISIGAGSAAITISSLLSGSGGITKAGTGTLTVSGNPNQFTGSTIISEGKVALGAQYAFWQSAYDTTGSTGAIGLTATGYATPWLGGLAGSVNLATAITGYSAITSLILNPQTGSSVSYGGVIANGSGAMTLVKSGHGTQTLTSANTYSGATTVWAGTLGLGGAAGSVLNSAFTVKGGTLLLDNSGGTWIDRLADGTAISLGSLTLKSDNGGSPQTETVGATTLATSGKITIDNGTGAGTTLAVNGTVTRAANSGVAIDFVGTGGTLGSGAGNPNVTATTLPSNANGILPWATVNGTLWAENNANSVRAYSGGFVDPTTDVSSATSNAQFTGSGTIGSAKSFNSLNVIASGADQSLSLSGILTLTSPGAILKSGSDSYSITGSVANAITAGAELIAHVDGGALTISAPLSTAILGLAKGGTGDLILSGTRAGTMSGAIGIAGGQLEFRGAGFTLSGVVTGVGGLTVNLNAGQTLFLNNNSNSYAGPTIVKGGYLASSAHSNQGMPGGIIQTPGSANTSLIMSNLKLEGGIFYSRYVTNKDLGAGPGQVQILAGTCGFVHDANSGGATGCTLDGGRELVWGSTYFNPTVFVHSTIGNLTLNLANGIDLAGSTRTVLVGDATYNALAGGGASQLGGVIRDSQNAGAGLIKTGVGTLLLSGANTFNGAVTVSQGTLAFSGNANVASANPLGQSSAAAANLLLANGTTLKYTGGAASSDRSFTINGTADGHSASLDASGSGALVLSNTSTPAYGTVDQTRTLILTGSSTNNNTLAATLADNGTGALSVNKTGSGTWVLTGTNSYMGATTLGGGLLSVDAAHNLGASSADLVFNGGGLQITGTTLTNLSGLGRTVIFNSGVTVAFDIAAAGNTFTVDQALTGITNVTKSGAGTLVFNPAFPGTVTIGSGTLKYIDGTVIPKTPLLNNGTLEVQRSDALVQGTRFHSLMGGTGSLIFSGAGSLTLNNVNTYTGTTKASAGTITLSHALAIQNSALDTTGAGTFALGGVTSPTFGGLSGASGDLAAVISSGYSGVTNLTLNPQSGSTVTYGGVIAYGAASMTLTKAGAGTQVLQGVNTYSGASFLREGTLTLSGNGSILNSAITLNGGAITLSNTNSAGGALNRVSDSAGLTSNGGTITYANTSGAGLVYGETAGSADLVSGQLNVVLSSNMAGGGGNVQALTLSGLTRSGASNTSVITVAGNGGLTTNNIIRVAGITTSTAAGQIIGPWATYGTPAGGQTDYAVYTSDGTYGRVVNASIGASAEDTWGAGANVTLNGATTLTATRTINSLRYSGGAQTLELGDYSLETYGLINGGSGLTISATGSGGLTTPAGGGYLYLTTGSAAITASAPINDNGGAVTLVKSGSYALTLNSGTSTYSGGTVINGSGQINVAGAIDPFGAAGSAVTVNTSITINNSASGAATFNRPFVLNNGAVINFNNGNSANTITGAVTGSGGVNPSGAGSIGQRTLSLTSTANTFTGPIAMNSVSGDNGTISVNSLGDAPGAGAIILAGGTGQFMWGSGAVAPLTLDNRQFVMSGGANLRINNANTASSHANTITVNTDLLVTGTGNKTLTLSGVNTGNNTFGGDIVDGPGAVISLSKADAGTWILSGANTFTGPTTVTAGTLVLAGSRCLSDTATLTIANTGTQKVQLDTGVMEKVGSLVIGTTAQATGTWGSATSIASYTNNTYFAGTGLLYVGIDPPPPPPLGSVIIVK